MSKLAQTALAFVLLALAFFAGWHSHAWYAGTTVTTADSATQPSLLELRSTGAASTAWFWRKHKLTGFGGDVLSVTRRINGGTNGIEDRQRRYVRALSVLQAM